MYYCILNPASKSGRKKPVFDALRAGFEEQGLPFQVVLTKAPGHAKRITQKLTAQKGSAADPVKIVVVGGDGTVNEVVNGITDFDRALVGILSKGSANDFLRGLNVKDAKRCVQRILTGAEVRRVDVGLLRTGEEERYFAVSCGIGFDAAVCEKALHTSVKSNLNQFGLGKLTYGGIAIKELIHAPRCNGTLTIDGEEIPLDKFLLAAAMNTAYEGGGFKFAPKADASDGFFDLMYVTTISVGTMFRKLPFAYVGRHENADGVTIVKTKSFRISLEEPLFVHTDGEVISAEKSIECTCLPARLRLMI